MIVISKKSLYFIFAIITLIAIYIFFTILPSVPLNNGMVAQKLIKEYLNKFTSSSLKEDERILEYTIDEIGTTKGNKSGFIFDVYFSVKPQSENTIWLSANGYWDKDGWVRRIFMTGLICKKKLRYKIKEIGTGGITPP